MDIININKISEKFVDKPLLFRFVLIPASNLGNMRSKPAEVSTTEPQMPIALLNPKEYPQKISTTIEQSQGFMEPENNSIPAQVYPLA